MPASRQRCVGHRCWIAKRLPKMRNYNHLAKRNRSTLCVTRTSLSCLTPLFGAKPAGAAQTAPHASSPPPPHRHRPGSPTHTPKISTQSPPACRVTHETAYFRLADNLGADVHKRPLFSKGTIHCALREPAPALAGAGILIDSTDGAVRSGKQDDQHHHDPRGEERSRDAGLQCDACDRERKW
jgi:hypothetical protein